MNRSALLFKVIQEDDKVKVANFIQQQGKDVLYDTNKKGQSILHVLIDKGNDQMVSFLLKNFPLEINAADRAGWTPLHSACSLGNLNIVQILLQQKNLDVSVQSVDLSTPLHYFVRRGVDHDIDNGQYYYRLITRLVKLGCDVNKQNVNNDTPLHHAASKGHEGVVQLLVQLGADVNMANKYGETCLHMATRIGHLKIVSLLLELGVDPLAVGRSGTAKEIAKESGKTEIIQMFEKEWVEKQNRINSLITQAKNTKKLNLSDLNLRVVPKEVWDLEDLEELNLSNNSLIEIPAYISKFTSLKDLKLDSNKLTNLPSSLSDLADTLQAITLSMNPDLPSYISSSYRTQPLQKFLKNLAVPPMLSFAQKKKSCGDFLSSPLVEEDDDEYIKCEEDEDEKEKPSRLKRNGKNSQISTKEQYLLNKERKLAEIMVIVEEKSKYLAEKEKKMAEREAKLKEREKYVDEREKFLDERERIIPPSRYSSGSSSSTLKKREHKEHKKENRKGSK